LHIGKLPVVTKSFAPFIGLFALVVAVGCDGGSTSAVNTNNDGGQVTASVSGTISVGTAPSAIAADSTTNKIYVADFGSEGNDGICSTCYCPGVNGTLTVIDGATQSPTTTAFSYAYSNPLDLAINPANHILYVASRVFFTVSPTCGYSDSVAVLDGATLTQAATTSVGSARLSAKVAVNQKTGNVYVTDWDDGTVTVLDGSGTLLSTIALAARPLGVAVDPTANRIYVANGNSISVIDGATNSLIGTIVDPNIINPGAVAVNPTTNTIYVAQGSNPLAVIDGVTNSVTATVAVGTSAAAVVVDAQTNFIYVANAGNCDFSQQGNVTVVNGSTKATTTLKDSNMPYPFGITVNPATNKIYVVSILSNNVTVIDGAHD
jgi:YVTN family beta-propeller protein